MNPTYYKCCAVPLCTNTTISTPTKLFIHAPKQPKIRRKWLLLARRNLSDISLKSILYFCEDHFDLPNDMENYTRYRLMGSVKQIKMKEGCVPSRFECQPDRRKRTAAITTRAVIIKRQRIALVEEALNDAKKKEITDIATDSQQVEGQVSPSEIQGTANQMEEDQCTQFSAMQSTQVDKSIQVSIYKQYRSKQTQSYISTMNIATSPLKSTFTNVSTSPFKKIDISTSGVKKALKKLVAEETSESEASVFTASLSRDEFSTSMQSIASEEQVIHEEEQKKLILQNTLQKIKRKPRFYIGVPQDCYFLIDIIQTETKISEEHILLCLKKIRLNTKFEELGDEFSMTMSYASKIFYNNVPIIANALRAFIVKLNNRSIKMNLPTAFRHKYHNVGCIIDCLEIEIQKPAKAINQALTWSEYKKANTVKYLISSTPDGVVNYISEGYGCRISDVQLVEDCDFLDSLNPGTFILADRGFKHIEHLLLVKGHHLMRPPSVATGSKLTKAEAKQTKEIASLRIHIERVIRRLREFSILKLHAVVNINLTRLLDEVIIIACALINLQDSIIKK